MLLLFTCVTDPKHPHATLPTAYHMTFCFSFAITFDFVFARLLFLICFYFAFADVVVIGGAVALVALR